MLKKVDLNPSDFEELRSRAPGATTQIFINDHHVGGCDDLYALHDQGKLDQLLKINLGEYYVRSAATICD